MEISGASRVTLWRNGPILSLYGVSGTSRLDCVYTYRFVSRIVTYTRIRSVAYTCENIPITLIAGFITDYPDS